MHTAPDHVANPEKYKRYEIDWDERDEPGMGYVIHVCGAPGISVNAHCLCSDAFVCTRGLKR